jgi:hypothetical protein
MHVQGNEAVSQGRHNPPRLRYGSVENAQ